MKGSYNSFDQNIFINCLQVGTWLEKEMATHSSILAWRIPGTEEPGGLLSMGSHRVGHDWSDLACMHALKKEMATHSSILAWRIPGTEDPGGLLFMGSHRVRHDWSDLAAAATAAIPISLSVPSPSPSPMQLQGCSLCLWVLFCFWDKLWVTRLLWIWNETMSKKIL